MTLYLDIGNTNTKIAIFKNNKIELLLNQNNKEITLFSIKTFLLNSGYKIKNIVYSCVKNNILTIFIKLKQLFNFNLISSRLFIFDYFNWKTNKEIGDDLLVSWFWFLVFQNKKLTTIIDFGTCTTILVIKDLLIQGVIISLGIEETIKSLNNSVFQIIINDYSWSNKVIGTTTKEATDIGIINNHFYGIKTHIDNINDHYDSLNNVICTGGNLNCYKNIIKINKWTIINSLNIWGLIFVDMTKQGYSFIDIQKIYNKSNN